MSGATEQIVHVNLPYASLNRGSIARNWCMCNKACVELAMVSSLKNLRKLLQEWRALRDSNSRPSGS